MREDLINNIGNFINSTNENDYPQIFKDLGQKLMNLVDNLDYFKFDSNIRFCDYYDINSSFDKNLEYYKSYDNDPDNINSFILYGLLNKLGDINMILNDEFSVDDILFLLNGDEDLSDTLNYLNYLEKYITDIEENQMPFMNEKNPFKIMFYNKAYDDVLKLPKPVLSQLTNKLYSPLATELIVPKAESLGHTNDSYGTSYKRIQFADDYRIVFFRKDDVTAILGVNLKTGKEIDYSRYDLIAKRHADLLTEIDQFSDGVYTEEHEKIIELLKNTSLEKKNKVSSSTIKK